MRRFRTVALFALTVVGLLVFADPALAVTHGGEGLYGPTNDITITETMFFLLGFFPALIAVLTIAQHYWEKFKHNRDAAKRAAEAPGPGGW